MNKLKRSAPIVSAWGAPWTCFPLKLIKYFRISFKVSRNVLKAIQHMEKHIFKKQLKLDKKWRSVVFELRLIPPSFQFIEAETPFQTGAAKNTGFPLPAAPSQKTHFPGLSRTPAFLILPALSYLPRLNSVQVQFRGRSSLLAPPDLTHRIESLPWALCHWEYWNLDFSFPSS